MTPKTSGPILGGSANQSIGRVPRSRIGIYGGLIVVFIVVFLSANYFRSKDPPKIFDNQTKRATLDHSTSEQAWALKADGKMHSMQAQMSQLTGTITGLATQLNTVKSELLLLGGRGNRGGHSSAPPVATSPFPTSIQPGNQPPTLNRQPSVAGRPRASRTRFLPPAPGRPVALAPVEEASKILRPILVQRIEPPARVVTRKSKIHRIPRGTLLPIRLLSGMDVPAGAQSQKSPLPVLMEVTDLSILPNTFKMDFEKCFVLGEGSGDASTERAYVRTVALSCINRAEESIDLDLKATVMGEDGKPGFHGNIVMRDGALLARALAAGFIDGIGKAFKPLANGVVISGGANAALELPDTSTLGIRGAAGALSGSATILAKRYTDLANQIFPVIEVKPQRWGSVLVLEKVESDGLDLMLSSNE